MNARLKAIRDGISPTTSNQRKRKREREVSEPSKRFSLKRDGRQFETPQSAFREPDQEQSEYCTANKKVRKSHASVLTRPYNSKDIDAERFGEPSNSNQWKEPPIESPASDRWKIKHPRLSLDSCYSKESDTQPLRRQSKEQEQDRGRYLDNNTSKRQYHSLDFQSCHPYRKYDQQSKLQDEGQPRRYSANNRLKKLRSDIQLSKRDSELSNKPFGQADSKHSNASKQTSSRLPSYEDNSHLIIPKSHSSEEKIRKSSISDSFNKIRSLNIQSPVNANFSGTSKIENGRNYRAADYSDNNRMTISSPNAVHNSEKYGTPVAYEVKNVDVNDTAMDWNYSDEEVISNLQELRKNVHVASAVPQTRFQEIVAKEAEDVHHCKRVAAQSVYFVVDTNIFLSHLETVKTAMKLQINGCVSPIIFVPWIVVQELDYIKDGKYQYELKNKAQQAVRFINDSFNAKTNLKGQSVRDAAKQDFASSNFDDGILHCCLQIRERRNNVVLLSNDINLRNKLMNEHIEAYGHDEIFKRFDPYKRSIPEIDEETEGRIKEVETRLSHMCTYIVLQELKECYGELWSRMGPVKENKLPWSLKCCLSLIEKFWISVFQMKLSPHSLKLIQGFSRSLEASNGRMDIDQLSNFGLALCVYLKSAFSRHSEMISECTKSIEDLCPNTDGHNSC